ncbi:hypothetical protein JCM6882_005673 [Rhodosporidiobolus microsporus]
MPPRDSVGTTVVGEPAFVEGEGEAVPLRKAAAPVAGREEREKAFVEAASEEKGEVVARKRRPIPVLTILLVPLLAVFLAAAVLILLVLLSPTLAHLDGLRKMGLLELRFGTVGGNVTAVLGPLGACFPSLVANSTSFTTSHYNCTSSTLTPVFNDLYTSLAVPPSARFFLPTSFPLFPTALLLALALLLLGTLPLLALTFPARSAPTLTSSRLAALLTPRRLFLLAAPSLVLSFSLGLAASLSQRASLVASLTAIDDAGLEEGEVQVQLGRAWTLLWVAFGLEGGAVLLGGVGSALLLDKQPGPGKKTQSAA